MNRQTESGVVLYYIFIAVVLFGALSFTVAQMMRGDSGERLRGEALELYASEIVDFGRTLATSVKTMRIGGVADTAVSFENTILAGYANANCAAGQCRIFDTAGGGVIYRIPAPQWLDMTRTAEAGYGQWLFSGANEVTGVGTDANGAASRELLAILPWLNRSTCTMINNMLQIANPGGDPPQDSGDAELATLFTGAYSDGETLGGGDPEIQGRRAGCFEGGGDPPAGSYHFFQVLIAR